MRNRITKTSNIKVTTGCFSAKIMFCASYNCVLKKPFCYAEYGMGGKITTEGGDVYSYGILLLELFSGQRPTGSSILIEHSSNLHDYVRNALPHRVMEIVDPRILLQQEDHSAMEACLSSIFEIGVSCSFERPRERIDISVALKKLYVTRDKLLRRGQSL